MNETQNETGQTCRNGQRAEISPELDVALTVEFIQTMAQVIIELTNVLPVLVRPVRDAEVQQ